MARRKQEPPSPIVTPASQTRSMNWIPARIRTYLDLSRGQATPEQVIEDIRSSAELNAGNIWVLLLAILVASVGLNINATAVIIGAMLISPLMGPIMAIGLGAGINDFELMRRSATNLGFAALASILVSALYFTLSPLQVEGNELLARASPTAWDVLVAIFGGLAGVIGATRSDKSNVVPGVAIATALMPPLCTAGYGLATGNLKFFGGALYLFYVNSICIGVGTLIVCRVLRYPRVTYIDPLRRRRVRRTIAAIVIVSVLPSGYFAYKLVQKTIFEKNATIFIKREIGSGETEILNRSISYENASIDVVTMGRPLSPDELKRLSQRLVDYGLENARLGVRSSLDFDAPYAAAKGPTEEEKRAREEATLKQLLAEMKVLFPAVKGVAVSTAPFVHHEGVIDRLTLVYVNADRINYPDGQKLKKWLESRTGSSVRVLIE
ncbi:MAG: TIGR00341 family protein [Leptospirales bacterium]|nr:TIGR00341 family protein [Leptospirales bacterium]